MLAVPKARPRRARAPGRSAPFTGSDRRRPRAPHHWVAAHAHDVRVAALRDRLAELGDLAVARVHEQQTLGYVPANGIIEKAQRDLPFALENDIVRYSRRATALAIAG